MGTSMQEPPAHLFDGPPLEESTGKNVAVRGSSAPVAHTPSMLGAGTTGPDNRMVLSVEAQRAIAETQAAMIVAQQFPRDEERAVRRIQTACSRLSLAGISSYSYSRGGTAITGPTVHLLKAIAQQWGNIQYATVELARKPGMLGQAGSSTMQTIAWDMETNARETRIFEVPHIRDKKGGGVPLTDERDIYELTANMASRRLRACLEGVIPEDVQQLAIEACDRTLMQQNLLEPEQIKKALAGMLSFGITRERIEAKWGRSVESAAPTQMLSLKRIAQAIADKVTTADEAFPPVDAITGTAASTKSGTQGLRDRMAKKDGEDAK